MGHPQSSEPFHRGQDVGCGQGAGKVQAWGKDQKEPKPSGCVAVGVLPALSGPLVPPSSHMGILTIPGVRAEAPVAMPWH